MHAFAIIFLFLFTMFLFPQFPAITVSGPSNGTICWHRGRPEVQCSRAHKQSPNYRPFQQHLGSRWSLTRGRGKGGFKTQVSETLAGTSIYDYIYYKALSIDHSSIFNPYGTSQMAQSITLNTYTKDDSVLSHKTLIRFNRSSTKHLIYQI